MKSYTEPSNVNSLEDVDCTDSDETLWKLINAKILYKSGMLCELFFIYYENIVDNVQNKNFSAMLIYSMKTFWISDFYQGIRILIFVV